MIADAVHSCVYRNICLYVDPRRCFHEYFVRRRYVYVLMYVVVADGSPSICISAGKDGSDVDQGQFGVVAEKYALVIP